MYSSVQQMLCFLSIKKNKLQDKEDCASGVWKPGKAGGTAQVLGIQGSGGALGPLRVRGTAPGRRGMPDRAELAHATATLGAWPAASAGRGRGAGTPPGHAAVSLAPPQPSPVAPQGSGSSWGAVSTWPPCTWCQQPPAWPGQP